MKTFTKLKHALCGLLTIGVPLMAADYTVTTTGNTIVVTDSAGNADTLAVSQPGAGNIKFAAAGRTFSVDGGTDITGDSGDISLSGVTGITVNAAAGADIIDVGAFTGTLPGLTLNGGTGDDAVNFIGDIAFAANANLDADLLNDDAAPGSDLVTVAASANIVTSGTGTITAKVRMNIAMAPGSSFETVDGDLTLNANVPANGAFAAPAIDLDGATVQTSGTGNVSVIGKGSTTSALGHPVQVRGGAKILSTGNVLATQGKLTVTGTTTGGFAHVAVTVTGAGSEIRSLKGAIAVTNPYDSLTSGGVRILSSGSIESTGTANIAISGVSTALLSGVLVDTLGQVKTADGAVSITGSGGNVHGIIVQGGAKVESTGLGTITMNGQGNPRSGVQVSGAGSKITSATGNISVTGNAFSSGRSGIIVETGAVLEGTGAASVTLTGRNSTQTGGNAPNCDGVVVSGVGAAVKTVNGILTVNGFSGNTNGSRAFYVLNGARVSSTTGDININAFGLPTNNGNFPKLVYNTTAAMTTTGTITLSTGANSDSSMDISAGTISGDAGVVLQTGALINLGATSDFLTNTLSLTDAELDRISTLGTLTIGSVTGGAITVSAPITRSAATVMSLNSAGNINISGGSIDSAGGNVTLTPGTGVLPSLSGVDVVTSATSTLKIASGKALNIAVNGATADTGYTQLNVAGLVDLSGANLAFSGSYVPAGGDTFTIVSNDGADAITGTFAGLAEGAAVSVNGVNRLITYIGGDGNDVVLVEGNVAPTNIALSNATIAENNAAGANIGTLSATDANASDTHTFTLAAGGADNGAFTITGSALTINGSADFETKSSYAIRIRATDSGEGNLFFEKDFTVTITDVTIPQTITFDPLGGKTFGDAAFAVSATGGASGQSVTFSIASGPATIAGSTVTLTGAGSVTVRASQAGAGDYSAATSVDQSFTVAKAAQSITFTPPADAFSSQSLTLSATGGASGNAVTFSVFSGPGSLAGNVLTFTGAGTVVVRASQAGDANYLAAADVDASIAVTLNGAPIGVDDAVVSTTGTTVVNPLANDTDADGEELTITAVSEPSVTIEGRTLIVPDGYIGTFSYTLSDGISSDSADVVVTAGTPQTTRSRWNGLFVDGDGAIVGRMNVSRAALGLYVSVLKIGPVTKVVKFRLTPDPDGTGTVATPMGATPGFGAMTITEDPVTGRLDISLARTAGGPLTASLRRSALVSPAQRVNVAIASIDSATIPGGGVMRLTQFTSGRTAYSITLPDGKTVSGKTDLADNGTLPFYAAVARTNPVAYIAGELNLANLARTDVTGELAWNKPPQSLAGLHQGGLETVLTANGSIILPTDVLPTGAVTLKLSGGNMAADLVIVTTATAGVPATTTPGVSFWLVKPNGGFTTKVQRTPLIKVGGAGVYLPKSNSAWGYFPGTTLGGRIELTQP